VECLAAWQARARWEATQATVRVSGGVPVQEEVGKEVAVWKEVEGKVEVWAV